MHRDNSFFIISKGIYRMKHLFWFSLVALMSHSTLAEELLVCKTEGRISYRLKVIQTVDAQSSKKQLHITLQKTYLVEGSCESRWGCDYKTQVYSATLVSLRTYDGPQYTKDIYTNKARGLKLEVIEDSGVLQLTVKNKLGVQSTKTVLMTCENQSPIQG
jgi:hypothetical protein